jgi:hypothetical protein
MHDTNEPMRLSPVRWLSPKELLRTGARAAVAGVFGAYADKRELQQGPLFEQEVFRHGRDGQDLWLDYVSDLGDGFDATYSVASLLATDLRPVGAASVLRRGDVLVMGGDQVYPYADVTTYEQRTTRVYEAAFPPTDGTPASGRPALYAVPGNHDWYDGLTAFLRVFGQRNDIGGWQTRQRRSYFALRLPHRWWLLAVDIQLDTYIDLPQLDYFRGIAAGIEPDASIILCTAVPCWYDESGASTERLSYFLKHAMGPRAEQVRLVLTGDVHHYARYQADAPGGPLLVTAGIGGAYTSATHLLPDEIVLSARFTRAEAGHAEREPYRRVGATWPPAADSRTAARGVLWRLPVRNWTLLPVLGALHGLLGASILAQAWLWTVVVLAVAGAGSVAFTRTRSVGRTRRLAYGATLAAVQMVAAAAVVWLFAAVIRPWPWPARAAAVVATIVVGGIVAAILLAAWLLTVSRWRVNENELFAAQSLDTYRGFLRLRLDADGELTVFPVGLRRPARRWEPGGDTGPRLVPARGERLDFELIEAPVRVSRHGGGA